MIGLLAGSAAICGVSAVMTMTGRGGGNFYVPILVICGLPMLEAATTGQCILLSTAAAGTLIFHKSGMVDWKLALVIDPPTDAMAFVGGYYAHYLGGWFLKAALAVLLFAAAVVMLLPIKERRIPNRRRLGFWQRRFGAHDYAVNLWLAVPVTAAVGLAAGMTGISGGSFKVPLMVLACGVPMRVAVGTSTAMVAATALTGFIGHAAAGDFNAGWAVVMSIAAVAGGVMGSKISLQVPAVKLKRIFVVTTLLAGCMMAASALLSGGG